jgi:DNA-binding CsgD family transcriptional regulator
VRTDEERVRAARAVLRDPFGAVPGLTDREREAALLASRGLPRRGIMKRMGLARQRVYQLLGSAAEKIGVQLEGAPMNWEQLGTAAWQAMREALE